MLVTHPAYTLPEWHPETVKGTPRWDELVKRTLIDKAAKLADTRTEIEEP